MFTLGWHYFRAFLLIYLSLFIGNFIASILPFTIPGSIVGMIFLFILLAFNIIPATWVRPGCLVFMRYMALAFIPISVSIIKYYDQLVEHLAPILISCLVSTIMTMLVVGLSAQFVYKKDAKS